MPRSPFLSAATRRIDELMARACPESSDGGLLVGLSGGPDSVALLLAACRWSLDTGRPVAAAHLNHQLRGEEADADSRFCAELCAARSVTCYLHGEDPRPVARTRGQGLEEAGRHLRRRFFRSLLLQHPELVCVATGHHRDDQVETVLMRLFRGTGPDGLRGIRPVQGPTIHPLLEFGRGDILAFLEQENQPWRVDAGNLEGDNTRSRIRRELLPLVRDIFGAGTDRGPARLAELLDGDLELLDRITGQALAGLLAADPSGNPEKALSIPGLLDLDPAQARRVLLRWLSLVRSRGADDIEMVHVVNILAWLREGSSGARLDLPGDGLLRRDFDYLHFQDGPAAGRPLRSPADYRILVSRTDPPADPAARGLDEGAGGGPDERERPGFASGPWNLTCPASVLEGNLRIRNRREGDRFHAFGLDGTRKLGDVLREHRVPTDRRDGILIVEDDVGILWVVGVARAERTRLLPSPAQTVTISVIERNS